MRKTVLVLTMGLAILAVTVGFSLAARSSAPGVPGSASDVPVPPGPFALGPVVGPGPREARSRVGAPPYKASVLYEQTWAEAEQHPELFQLAAYRSDGGFVEDPSLADTCWGPSSIAVSHTGQIYVSDTAAGRVLVLDADGRLCGCLQPDSPAELTDVGVDNRGQVYVLDEDQTPGIYCFDRSSIQKAFYALDSDHAFNLQVYSSGSFDVADLVTAPGAEGWRVTHFDSKGKRVGSDKRSTMDQSLFAFEDSTGRQYRILRVGGRHVQVQAVVSGKGQPNLDYLECENDLANYVIGFRGSRLYRLVEYDDPLGSGETHLYVQVVNLASASTYAVDLGPCTDLVRRVTRVAVDIRGWIYHLKTSPDGLEIVRYAPVGDH